MCPIGLVNIQDTNYANLQAGSRLAGNLAEAISRVSLLAKQWTIVVKIWLIYALGRFDNVTWIGVWVIIDHI